MRAVICLVIAAILLLLGCGAEPEPYRPTFSAQQAGVGRELTFGIHPLHNPERLLDRYGPIIDYLNRHVAGVRFVLEASRSYEDFDKKLYAGHFDFALPNPYQTVRALDRGYRVFGKMGDDENFRGLLLVRRDGGIRTLADLKGKKVGFPAPTALAATMMPKFYLHSHGVDVNTDIENVYAGSQESSIMQVYLGNVAAAATWPVPWLTFQKEEPRKAAQLEVKWQTAPLINNGLVTRQDMPPAVVEQVAQLLANLHQSDEGRAMLQRLPISRFERADDAAYAVVADFLSRYSAAIGPLQ